MSENHAGTIASLSYLEKAALLSGENTWETRAIPRLGIRSLWLSDGPHGIRKQLGSSDHLGINSSEPATCFPTAATIANSWDPDLGQRIGVALGEEAARLGVDVVLGPGLNIKRSPLGGRNFEYFSEDPYLAGKLAASYIRGIQGAGVAACPKHFAVNSQETARMTSDSIVDEATLRELYLTAFEIAVREGDPKALMSSYNLVNGIYANENAHLLTQILRTEWGFDGAVVTDWGGGNDAVAALGAGGTLEMPSPGYDSVAELLRERSRISVPDLDKRVSELIGLASRINAVVPDRDLTDDHDRLAQEAAEQSIVLLKNEGGILPLAEASKVAVLGRFAFEPRYQGAGSSLVNPTRLSIPIDALKDAGFRVVAQESAFEHGRPLDPESRSRAVLAARQADIVLMYLGLDEVTESEGKDRCDMLLPQAQQDLLAAVSEVNPRTVVVFSSGSAVEMPWLHECQALVHAYLGGQAGARAVVRVLSGQVNPSGRLAESYPIALSDTPTAGHFPAQGRYALYREGPYIGYRYYSSADVPVLFPFGYGLSYTSFEYSGLEIDQHQASFTVTNTGTVSGADVPQLYVSPPEDAHRLGPRAALELKNFVKLTLNPGESRRISLPFDAYSFRAYDVRADAWLIVEGEYGISIGHHVNDRPLVGTVMVAGTHAEPGPSGAIDSYRRADVHRVTDAEFAVLLGRQVPDESRIPDRLHLNSPLSDLRYAHGMVGRAIYKYYFLRSMRKAEEKGISDLNLLFQYVMPFRAIAKMSGGLASTAMAESIIEIVDGHLLRGVAGVIGGFFCNRKEQRTLKRRFTRLSAAANPPHSRGDTNRV